MNIFGFNRGHYASSVKVISENDIHIQTKEAYDTALIPTDLFPAILSKQPCKITSNMTIIKNAAYATTIAEIGDASYIDVYRRSPGNPPLPDLNKPFEGSA